MAKELARSSLPFPLPVDEPTGVTRNQITRMLFESHRKCTNASEEVGVLKEIAKINDLYPKDGNRIEVNLTTVVHSLKALEVMDDEALLSMAGADPGLLSLPVIEGTFSKVDERKVKKKVTKAKRAGVTK